MGEMVCVLRVSRVYVCCAVASPQLYHVGNWLNVGGVSVCMRIAFRFCMSFFGVVSLVRLVVH